MLRQFVDRMSRETGLSRLPIGKDLLVTSIDMHSRFQEREGQDGYMARSHFTVMPYHCYSD
jgi:hypothetical protein